MFDRLNAGALQIAKHRRAGIGQEEQILRAHGKRRIAAIARRHGRAGSQKSDFDHDSAFQSIQIAIDKRGALSVRVHAIVQLAQDVAFVGIDVHLDGPAQLDQFVAHLLGFGGWDSARRCPRRSTESAR